jgi:hypothetical protein
MSDLLDGLTGKGGEFVPVEGGAGPGESGPDSGSPFDRFINRLVPGGPPDDEFNRALLYAAIGSLLALAGAVLLALLPSGDTIRDSGFFVLGKLTLANFVDAAGSAAGPVALMAFVLLLVTGAVALSKQRGDAAAAVCVAQPVVGVLSLGGSGLAWAAFLAVIALNLAIYAVLVAVGFGVLLAVLAGAGE